MVEMRRTSESCQDGLTFLLLRVDLEVSGACATQYVPFVPFVPLAPFGNFGGRGKEVSGICGREFLTGRPKP